jgi:biopolymer transport protein ExbD
MQDDMFQKPHRRPQKDLNIVPILDMMTTIVFFLLLSTSFIEFTKITVPPSRVSTITAPERPPPAQPKLYVMKVPEGIRLQLNWSGKNAGSRFELYTSEPSPDPATDQLRHDADRIQELAKKMTEEYKQKFPDEKTLQVGMGSQVPYEDLIAVMDGVRDQMGDIVLISHTEVDAETERSGVGAGAGSAQAPGQGEGG